MDRNDTAYFRRITPELLESAFKGYKVPENIRQRAKLIMKRFSLWCDGMYIANCIAFDNGTGDGQGHFEKGEIKPENMNRIVNFLMGAYSSSILQSDKEDLMEIIQSGTLSKERMLSGLKKAIKDRRKQINYIRNCKKDYRNSSALYQHSFENVSERLKELRKADKEADNWRIEFLYGEINVIKDTIKMEEAA